MPTRALFWLPRAQDLLTRGYNKREPDVLENMHDRLAQEVEAVQFGIEENVGADHVGLDDEDGATRQSQKSSDQDGNQKEEEAVEMYGKELNQLLLLYELSRARRIAWF